MARLLSIVHVTGASPDIRKPSHPKIVRCRRLVVRANIFLLAISLTACTTASAIQPRMAPAPQLLVLFSPTSVTGESIRDETIRRIDATIRNLDVAMYTFNEPTLADALIRAKGRGVVLRVIVDITQAHLANSQADVLVAAGILVKRIKGIKGNGIMHHKVAIYEGAIVQTGSFNWTDNASCCSWENSLFVTDRQIVQRYQEEFDRMWNRG